MNLSFKLKRKPSNIGTTPFLKQQQKPQNDIEVSEIVSEPDIAAPDAPPAQAESPVEPEEQKLTLSEEELNRRIREEAETLAETLANQKVEAVLTTLQDAITQFEKAANQFFEDLEKNMIRLSWEIAKKVIRKELDEADAVVEKTIKAILSKIQSSSRVRVRCHPEICEALTKKESFQQWLKQSQIQLQFIGQDQIEKGGCIVETDYGNIDATLETQLNELERALFAQEDE